MGDLATTLVVQFTDDTTKEDEKAGYISAEVDSRADGLNKGDTSFEPGDMVFFLVYMNSVTSIDQIITSGGAVNSAGSSNVQIEEYITFDNSKESSVGKPILGITSVTWYGNNLGNLTIADDEITLIAGRKGVGVAKIVYTAKAHAYVLASPASINGETKFQIAIVVIGKLLT